jgi:hypothetical protein
VVAKAGIIGGIGGFDGMTVCHGLAIGIGGIGPVLRFSIGPMTPMVPMPFFGLIERPQFRGNVTLSTKWRLTLVESVVRLANINTIQEKIALPPFYGPTDVCSSRSMERR